MTPSSVMTQFREALKGGADISRRAATIIALAPELPNEALPLMDEYLDDAPPLIKVAIMDAYFEMTEDDYHRDDLERILDAAAKGGDDAEETYMAARIALSRISELLDAKDPWGIGDLEIVGIKTRAAPKRRAAPGAKPVDSITLMIHGTWASDGKWWRKDGDFFEYVRRDLQRDDLYGKPDQFRWSGKNRDTSRRAAAKSMKSWLASHPAAEVNVFAHSHGANVAMLSTHEGVKIHRLVMLSPPVRKDYWAKWSNVGRAYNIQASFDPVVGIARGGQWFETTNVMEKRMGTSGHSSSHDPKVWRKERLPAFVGIPW